MISRRDPRFRVHLPIHFRRRSLTGTGFAANLSSEGCLIESDAGLVEGDYLDLTLHLPHVDPPLRIESAAVRWVNGRMCGLQFLYMDAEEDRRLARALGLIPSAAEGVDSSTPEGGSEAPDDRRKSSRFTVGFQGSFSSGKMLGGQGIVKELSRRGCRIASDTPVPARSELEATIHLDVVHEPIRIEVAVVRWSEGNEFGLEFMVAEPETFDRLGRFLSELGPSSSDHGD